MQDKETDTYWSIMKGKAIGGELEGSPLVELPVTSKVQWKDWLRRHPETLVLSVGGREDYPGNAYEDYMVSDGGFMGAAATDRRLKTKAEIFAFDLAGMKFAVPFRVSEGGAVFKIGDVQVFLYRPVSSEVYSSTMAFRTEQSSFEIDEGRWFHKESGRVFSPDSGDFVGNGASLVKRMTGFDTFWYTWSALNPETEVLSHPFLRHPDSKVRVDQRDPR